MALSSIKEILMERDQMSEKEAQDLIEEARNEAIERLESGDIFDMDAEICSDYFGLEPDYFWEILPM